MPWMAIHRSQSPKDGFFVALEYLGNWSLVVDHKANGPLLATAAIPEFKMHSLRPGERLALPVVTFGAFCGGLDNRMQARKLTFVHKRNGFQVHF